MHANTVFSNGGNPQVQLSIVEYFVYDETILYQKTPLKDLYYNHT